MSSLTALLASLTRATWRWRNVPRERWCVESLPDGGIRLTLELGRSEVIDDRPQLGPAPTSMGPSAAGKPKG